MCRCTRGCTRGCTIFTRPSFPLWRGSGKRLVIMVCCLTTAYPPAEKAIWHQFLPAMTGRQAISDLERDLLALPAWHGGLSIQIPTRNFNNQFKACRKVTAPPCEPHPLTESSHLPHVDPDQEQKIAFRKRNRRETAQVIEAPTIRGWAKVSGTG